MAKSQKWTSPFASDSRYTLEVTCREVSVNHDTGKTTLGLSAKVKFSGSLQYGSFGLDGSAYSTSLDGRNRNGTWTYDFRTSTEQTVFSEYQETYVIVNADAPRFGVSVTVAIHGKGSATVSARFDGTPLQQGKVYVRASNAYRKGQAYVFARGQWRKAKAVYLFTRGQWRKSK